MTTTTRSGLDRAVTRSSAAGVAARPRRRRKPSAWIQWTALTRRSVWSMIRHGELLVAIVAPLIFTLGFYLPLKFVMQLQGINYAQFLMPIIVLQAMAFTAI